MRKNYDELGELRRANPVLPGSVPSADSPRAQALFEEITMSDDAAFANRRSAAPPSRRRWVGGIAAAIVLIGGGAAAVALRSPTPGDDSTDGARPTADLTYVERQLGGRLEGVVRVKFYDRIEQLLPNREYQAEGKPPWKASERAAVGEFVDANRGYGFRPDGERFDFDSSEDGNRSIHFDFRVDENLGGEGPNSIRIGVIVPSGTDFERARQGFLDLGKVAVILEKSPIFDYEEGLFSVVMDGTIVATIGPNGELSLPFVAEQDRAQMLERVDTLDELRMEAQKPMKTIKVRQDGGGLQAPDE